MAFLIKRPQVGDAIQFYTLGKNKSVLLVGLGNIGSEYDHTRHNAGFMCIDHFVAKTDGMSDWINKTDQKCYQSTGRVGEVRVIAIKPTTLMNLSGESVQSVAQFYKVHPQDIVLIHDELDINFGLVRTRQGGSAAGHNGVKSVSKHIGEDTGRIRIGIGPKHPEQIDSADFVLGKFDKKESEQLSNMQREVTAILSEYLYGGQLPTDTRNFIV